MILWNLPWLEITILIPIFGCIWVSRIRDPNIASRRGLFFTGVAFASSLATLISFYVGAPLESSRAWSLQVRFLKHRFLEVDELSAPIVAVGALFHYLTALATTRTKMRRFSSTLSLALEAIRLATFACKEPWLLIGLLAGGALPPYIELRNRNRPTRIYVLHMGLFIGLLVSGWALVDLEEAESVHTTWAILPVLAALLIRSGTVPAHCWLIDWFENASFGNALLFVAPLTGVYAIIRLVLPIAPDVLLHAMGLLSLATAVYAAGMATIQRETRRFFAYLFLSQTSLVLVGLQLLNPISLTGALSMWYSVIFALGGLGLTLRALEARFGPLSLVAYHGLYEHSPALAVCFLLTGLASVGFPGTLGFVATELLVDGAVETNPYHGFVVVVAAALNGIAVLRAYFFLFTGARHVASVSLDLGVRERIAVFTLAALILIGGLFPQPGVNSRFQAAQTILKDRAERAGTPIEPPAAHAGLAGEPDDKQN